MGPTKVFKRITTASPTLTRTITTASKAIRIGMEIMSGVVVVVAVVVVTNTGEEEEEGWGNGG